jgi:hypothetical protein
MRSELWQHGCCAYHHCAACRLCLTANAATPDRHSAMAPRTAPPGAVQAIGAVLLALLVLSAVAPFTAAQTCAEGTFGAGGTDPCTTCPAGKFSGVGATACSDTVIPGTVSTSADGAQSVYAADLDGDGMIDVLSASNQDDKIAWYKNNGGAPLWRSWTAYTISTAADGAKSVYAADLDGDGNLDVLSASSNDNRITWYKNNPSTIGTGPPPTWTTQTITGASQVNAVFAADVDGDGLVDPLSASSGDNRIVWYKYSAGPPVMWTLYDITGYAQFAMSVHAADLDGDGMIDVLSASRDDDKVAWYKNEGGTPVVSWTPYTISNTTDGPVSVYAVDVDGDGSLDVVSASGYDNKVVWHKNGGGSPLVWTTYTITTTAMGVTSVYAADVDGDGRVDVLSSNFDADTIAWYKNQGGTPVTWTPSIITTAVDGPTSVHAADLDGDGQLDVLSASAADDKVAWFWNLMCARGRVGVDGFGTFCSYCSPGRFAPRSLSATCEFCPGGRFGTTVGAITCNSCIAGRYSDAGAIECVGCPEGYVCPSPGTSSSDVALCPLGRYSSVEATVCTSCPRGYTSYSRPATSYVACDQVYDPVSTDDLARLYAFTNGPGWTGNLRGWEDLSNTDVDPCTPEPWAGLECSGYSIVYVSCWQEGGVRRWEWGVGRVSPREGGLGTWLFVFETVLTVPQVVHESCR